MSKLATWRSEDQVLVLDVMIYDDGRVEIAVDSPEGGTPYVRLSPEQRGQLLQHLGLYDSERCRCTTPGGNYSPSRCPVHKDRPAV